MHASCARAVLNGGHERSRAVACAGVAGRGWACGWGWARGRGWRASGGRVSGPRGAASLGGRADGGGDARLRRSRRPVLCLKGRAGRASGGRAGRGFSCFRWSRGPGFLVLPVVARAGVSRASGGRAGRGSWRFRRSRGPVVPRPPAVVRAGRSGSGGSTSGHRSDGPGERDTEVATDDAVHVKGPRRTDGSKVDGRKAPLCRPAVRPNTHGQRLSGARHIRNPDGRPLTAPHGPTTPRGPPTSFVEDEK